MKRIYIILGIVIAVGAVGILIFVLAAKPSSPTQTPAGTTGALPGVSTLPAPIPPSGSSPSVGGNPGTLAQVPGGTTKGAIRTVSGDSALNYFVDASSTVIIAEPNGLIEQVANGQSTYLSSSEISGVLSGLFSYDGQKVLLATGDPFAPQWSVFDVKTKVWNALGIHSPAIAWSPSSYRIAYFATVKSGVALQTVDLSNPKSVPQSLIVFPSEDFGITWPSSSTILLTDRSSAYISGSVFAFNLKTNTLANVVQNKVGLEARWNNAGTLALVLAGTALTRGGQLGVVDASGNLLHELNFLTLPSKCAFGGIASSSLSATAPELICGIPRDAAKLSNSALPDAYEEKTFYTADDFYKVDLNSGNVSALFTDPAQIFDAANVSFFNGAVFFVNRYDGKLYEMTLG